MQLTAKDDTGFINSNRIQALSICCRQFYRALLQRLVSSCAAIFLFPMPM